MDNNILNRALELACERVQDGQYCNMTKTPNCQNGDSRAECMLCFKEMYKQLAIKEREDSK